MQDEDEIQHHVLIVAWFAARGELFERFAEGSHTLRDEIGLVLRDSELNVAEHEITIKLRRLDIVIRSLVKLVHDE